MMRIELKISRNIRYIRTIRRTERGSILILSLSYLALLAWLNLSLGLEGSVGAKLMKRELERFREKNLFLTGVNLVGYEIEKDGEPHVDFAGDRWYGVLSLESPWGEKIGIEVEDEGSKLDLNLASQKLIENFLKNLEREKGIKFEEEPKDMAKAITEWKAKKKNRRLESLEEMLLIEAISRKDYFAIKPFVTVYSSGGAFPRVNVNTAPILLIDAILETQGVDSFARKEFLKKLREEREEEGREPFRPEELTPHAFVERLKLTPSISMVSLLNQLLPFLTTDAEVFHLKIRVKETGRAAEAVIQERPSGNPNFEVLHWHGE